MRTTYRKAKEHEIIKGESQNCNIPALRSKRRKILYSYKLIPIYLQMKF